MIADEHKALASRHEYRHACRTDPTTRARSSNGRVVAARTEELVRLCPRTCCDSVGGRALGARQGAARRARRPDHRREDGHGLAVGAHRRRRSMPQSHEKFRSVVQMLNQAMMLKRRVVENLRPSLLDHFGLAVALRSHFDENCGRAGHRMRRDAARGDAGSRRPRRSSRCSASRRRRWRTCIARGGAKHVEVVIEPEGEGYVDARGRRRRARWTTDLTRSLAEHASPHVRAPAEVSKRRRVPGQGNRIRVFVPRSPAGSA